jgi:hypothetical protein
MKKRISTPIIGGLIFGAISFLVSAVNFTITISEDLILGPWEMLNTLSAALFGPIGLLITELGTDIGAYLYLIRGVYPAPQDLYFIIGDYIAHSVSMLVTAFGYRFIYKRAKMPLFLVCWVLILGIFYSILFLIQVSLFNIAVPGLGATYMGYFSNVIPESISTIVITSLILLALPERFRRPRWYESKKALDRSSKVPVEENEGAQCK